MPLTFGGHGRAATVARDAAWYPVGIAREARVRDVLHCTTMRGPLRAQLPVVVTVHDCALLRYPEAFPPWHRHTGRVALRQAVREADAVVAVSAFTRDELVELLDVPVERIRVVRNGVDPVFTEAGPTTAGDYVLAVGTLEPRKNLARAVEAARRAGVELRVVGAPGWGGVEVPGWVGRVDDEELAALYRGARCLVFPSLYEGFGIPILEAMACGTPVVTTRGGATEEVAGGAAVLVDPLDPESIAAGIVEAGRRRDELVGSASSGRGVHLDARGRPPRGALAGARMSEPLVVVDADVLGRHRTGDETYVLNLLRELPRARRGRRAPDRCRHTTSRPRPGGHRGDRARHREPGAADGLVAAAAARRDRRRARPHAVRAAAAVPVPRRRHDPRPLVRARHRDDGPPRPDRVPPRRAALGPPRRPGADRLRALAAGPRRALRAAREARSS